MMSHDGPGPGGGLEMRRPNGLQGSNPFPSALTGRGFRASGFGSRFLIRPRCWDDCWDVERPCDACPHLL